MSYSELLIAGKAVSWFDTMFDVKYNTLDVSLILVFKAVRDAAVVVAREAAP
jgi:hypothetical protein